MSPKEDLNDIVQNFVDQDLASLDRVGGESDSFTLSPHLAQPSPDLVLGQGSSGAFGDSKSAPNTGDSPQKPSSSALTGPSTGSSTPSGTGSSSQLKAAPQSQTPGADSINSAEKSTAQDISSPKSTELKNIGSQAQNAQSHPSTPLGNTSISGSASASVKSPSKLNKEASIAESTAESKVLPKARGSQNDPLVAAVEDQHSRQVSASSSPSVTSENRKSFGNKLKAFGKRIASGSQQK